ncbi:MAG: saccharopine dehydrogenase [Bacteroidetes bacterium RIFOXYA12_FULL_35_11]|nr:MAG: saccharopine dehydrogenase [Bacteroidetes bacterium GWF2_35_48]OFY73687.1 MAG: saccharopine dehydrogenase [Bacteroidetes bacterium RIFOXYA12_FULL_35_11]OFY96710.1 MAG: saccharopine dehydrogenase [Bacteroidetes bacterium RIFOXYB2_FULL_35_7]OFZ04234.1 MAG: saccharopine dehydrogenase [Bacteroidetes bacterium RIFOXYC12_FULL_35_7]HBX52913.1 saccharopine dehydrogenase [Bacteroidales bacterium]
MSKIIVLGAGMVGRAMAFDLSKKHEVTSADINTEALAKASRDGKIITIQQNLKDTEKLARLVADFDLVVSAVPGFMGFETLKTIISCGKNFVDISFLPEDILQLNELAKKNKVIGIADMGVAPGMPNLIAGYHYAQMKITDFEYMVGGLPKARVLPFQYKAPFSPVDVIEEYTRPARYVENGHIITRPAMSDSEFINFKEVGTLEAFNTDGLRSLIYTLSEIPNMKEKTLRYPGHISLIRAFQESGFFSHTPVKINNTEVSPFDFTTKLLFDKWKLGDEEAEFTIMRVIVTGEEKGKEKKITYDLYDEYDPGDKISSMSRTTGFTGTAGAELILRGLFTEKGVFPPESVGKISDCFNFVLDYLKERKVIYKVTEEV